MVSDSYSFGRFTRIRPCGYKRVAVYMSVPARLRPQGWPPTLRLPEQSKIQHGTLNDPAFIARVQRDADRLNARLDARRALEARAPVPERRTAAEIVEIFYRTMRFRRLSDLRKTRTRSLLRKIVDWSVSRGNPPFADLLKADVEDFLSIYDDRPAAQTEARWLWNLLMLEAIDNRWRTDNACERIPWPDRTPRAVNVWTHETVDRYSAAANRMNQPGLAALLQFAFFAGQRMGDLRRAKHGVHFNGERFTLKQSKRGATVSFLVPKQVVDLLERVRVPGSPYLFTDSDSGSMFTESRLAARFVEVRVAVAVPGEAKLQLRALRHSAVCRLVQANVPVLKIAGVTGHAPQSVQKIIERYAVDYQRFADDAMRMMNRAEGGSDDDFSDTLPILNQDWLAKEGARERYTGASFDPARPGRFLGALLGQHRHGWNLPPDLVDWTEVDDVQSGPGPTPRAAAGLP